MNKLPVLILAVFIIVSCNSMQKIENNETDKSNEAQNYKPSEEEYNTTFNEANILIEKLNDIIKARQYDMWLEYLTKEYISEKSDPQFLHDLSSQPTLMVQKIVLKSLRDYFEYVIVPSRANSKLDKIVFVSENRIKALSTLYGNSVILYNLVRIDGAWKIGIAK